MPAIFEKINITLKTYCKAYKFLKQQYSPERIKQIQNEKLTRLIKYSYENIKYYREIFDANSIKPKDIRTIDDLQKIPILTKKELRHQSWDFLPKHLPPCRVSRTSGSTGQPLCLFSDTNSRINNSAAVIRYRKQLGINLLGSDILTLLKTENDPPKPPHWTFLQGVHKTYYINPYSQTLADIDYAARTITKLKNPAIIAITPAIKALAYKIKNSKLPPLKPSAVLTTGECLSKKVRNLLEETFNIKVTDIYACNEAGDIAWQCLAGQHYHINAENCIVEIIKDNQPAKTGHSGEVVITNLNRFAMPIIRYKNGDLAKLTNQKCPCGCQLPLISEIIGRTGEDILLTSGKTVPWNQLKSYMTHQKIRQFQIVQNEDAAITVNFTTESDADIPKIKTLLKSRFRSALGPKIHPKFIAVKNIPPAPNGKTKLVISKYKHHDNQYGA